MLSTHIADYFASYFAAHPLAPVLIVFWMLAGYFVLAAFLVAGGWNILRWLMFGGAAILLALGWFAP